MVAFTRGKRLDPRMLSPQMRAFFGERIPPKKLLMSRGGLSGPNPVLSNPSVLAGPNLATLFVTTNDPTGTLYWVVTPSNMTPTVEQIIAGKDAFGVVATAHGNQFVTVLGVQTVNVTGLLINHTYTGFMVQANHNNHYSNIASTGPFVTSGPALRFEFASNSMYLAGPS